MNKNWNIEKDNKMTTVETVSLKTAKLAKRKGFKNECLKAYSKDDWGYIDLDNATDHIGKAYFTTKDIDFCKSNGYKSWLAPTQSQLQRWLRDEHNIFLVVRMKYTVGLAIKPKYFFHYVFFDEAYGVKLHADKHFFEPKIYNTYEKALEKGLQAVLKLIIY